MVVETLRCPACNAADTSPLHPAGYHQCQYCGVRYRIRRGVPIRADPPARAGAGRLILAGVLVVALGLVVTIFFTLRAEGTPVPASGESPQLDAQAAAPSRATEVQPDPPSSGSSPAPKAPAAPPAQEVEAPAAQPRESLHVVEIPVPEGLDPSAPATASFELHSRRPSLDSSFYAIGWVTNTSPFPIDRPKITVVLLDKNGDEVGTDFGFAEGDVLDPGARAPASVLVSDPPPFETMKFEVSARRATFLPKSVEGLRIEHSPPKPDVFGVAIAGKIHHEGSVPARFVQVTALALDADGKLVGVETTYADDEILQPGKSSRFEVTMSRTERPAMKYELSASAWAAQ
ncbi:MAG TPA: FxLYD domain-containing protein [Nannocystis sp.]